MVYAREETTPVERDISSKSHSTHVLIDTGH